MSDSKLVDLLVELIAIPSVNPEIADDPDQKGEGRLAEHLAGYFDALGFHVSMDPVKPERPNLMAAFGPDQPRKTLMFESHLDTVGVKGMTQSPFVARIDGGRIYGRGACDTKGPLAACLHALQPAILDELAEAGYRVVFVGAMGEETGNVGAINLMEKGFGADEAIILEPTELNIVTAHKGAFWFEVEAHGQAAHGSNPSLGLSAIAGMRNVMDTLDRLHRSDQNRLTHPKLGKPTMNIGRIQGGCAANIVPEVCRIDVDRRTLPGERHSALLKRYSNALKRIEKKGFVRSINLVLKKDGAPFSTNEQSGLVRRMASAFEPLGLPARLEGAAWYSDAGPLAKTCRDVVVFGPGSIAQAHTADEFIEIDSLIKGAKILEKFLAITRHDNE